MTSRSHRTAGPAPQELVLTVGAPAHGGHCVARPAQDPTGRVVFVRHALPGETVRGLVTHTTAKIWRADAIEVLQASPDRVRPVWPEAGPGGVGGGELSHVALPAQRTWKQWVLADCLRRIGGPDVAAAVAALPESGGRGAVEVEAMASEAAAEASPRARARARAGTGTRTRVSLTVTSTGEAGMHGYRSREVLPLRTLPLAVPEIQGLGLTERSHWRRLYRPGARIEAVAPSTGEPVVLIDGTALSASARPTRRRRVEERVDASALGMGELCYSVHAQGFWQVHRDAPAALVDSVVRAVVTGSPSGGGANLSVGPAAGSTVLELYSGAGLLTLPLALAGARVRSVEGSEQAVRDARRTLHEHEDVELTCGRVTAGVVDQLGRFEGGAADTVILDPPRRGAGREVMEAISALGPQRVVLITCDPAALARDLGALLRGRYSLAAIRALDMFPHTHHLETVVVLERD